MADMRNGHAMLPNCCARRAKRSPRPRRTTAALRLILDKRKDKLRGYFDELAGRFGRNYVPGRSWKGLAEMFLKLMPPLVVADLGAGEGTLSLLLTQRAERVIAVDHSEKMLDYVVDIAKRNGVKNLEYRLGDLEELPICRRGSRSGTAAPKSSPRAASRKSCRRSMAHREAGRPHRRDGPGEASIRRSSRNVCRCVARILAVELVDMLQNAGSVPWRFPWCTARKKRRISRRCSLSVRDRRRQPVAPEFGRYNGIYPFQPGEFMATKRIGILTGGGDVPGLNAVIKNVVYRASEQRHRSRRHPPRMGRSHACQSGRSRQHGAIRSAADRENTRTVDRTGGTFLHSSRTNPSKMKKLPEFLKGAEFPKSEFTKKGMTSTVYRHELAGSEESREARAGLPDRDRRRRHAQLRGARSTSSASKSSRFRRRWTTTFATPSTASDSPPRSAAPRMRINRQRTTIGSHERIGVFRVFGRDAGYTALYTAYVTSMRCGIPEYKFDLEKMVELLVAGQAEQPEQLLAWSSCPKAPSGKASRSRNTASRMLSATARR